MKTIKVKIYSYNELSEKSKEKVKNELINSGYFYEHIFSDAANTLEKFCKIFNIKYYNIDFLELYRNNYKLVHKENVLNFHGPRLVSYLWNNYSTEIFKPKFIGNLKTNEYIKHNRIKSPLEPNKQNNRFNPYFSGCQISSDCPLTGVCYDYDILEPLIKVMLCIDLNTTFEDVLNNCINDLCSAIEKEYNYYCSEDGINEYFEFNERQFLENGQEF